MAFNWQTFWTRAFTALVFVAIMLAGLLWNQLSFFLLFSVVHFGCWVEYQRLVGIFDPEYRKITPFHRYGTMLAGWSAMLFASGHGLDTLQISFSAIGWWMGLVLLIVLPITELLFNRDIQLRQIRHSVTGLLYISLSWSLLVNLRTHSAYGLLLPLGIIFSIWINDTMAYLVGSMIGKTPLSAISPKKTWEGTLGGIFISIGVMALLARFTQLPVLHTAIIASIAAITGTVGDLLESKLKRMAGVKDSGQIMPGHGGFLDRFDSLLFATPFVWVYVKLFLD